MEITVKERLIKFIRHKEVTIAEFQRRCGLSSGYVNNMVNGIGYTKIEAIKREFPDLNTVWLLKGEVEMCEKSLPSPFCGDALVGAGAAAAIASPFPGASLIGAAAAALAGKFMNKSEPEEPKPSDSCPHCGRTEIEDAEIIEELRQPIVPTEWTHKPGVDLLREVQKRQDEVSMARVIALDVPIDVWHIVRDESLMPDCKRGDMLALNAYPKDRAKPIPGKLHAVDTVSNGLIVRKLYYEDYGFRAVAPNKEFPDMRLEHEEIIRIYRIVCLARIAL
jgi:hypothetical protein